MLIDKMVEQAKEYFPDLKINFKDESRFMKIINKLLFFNKTFMENFVTTIGSTIYFPSKQKLQLTQILSLITLFHELVHIYDSKNNKLFKFLYLFPQTLSILILPLLFLVSWKIILPLSVLFLLPLPAYFRMRYERRAYFISLYTLYRFYKSEEILFQFKNEYVQNFKTLSYYGMWYLPGLDKQFTDMCKHIMSGGKPLDGEIMNIIDNLINDLFKVKY